MAAYRLSTCVYCAAIRYKLSGLAELAQEKITAHGHDLTIFDILSVAREHAFPILPEDETWFPSYLEGAIKGAVKDDPALFMKPGFVDQIEGDRKFRQVIMKAIINTYSGGVDGQDSLPTEETQEEAESEQPSDFPKDQESPESTPTSLDQANLAVEDSMGGSVRLDDIEPSVPESPVHRPASLMSPQAPESVTDELDLMNRTFQSTLAMRPRPSGEDVTNSTPKHVRNDSLIQTDEDALVNYQQNEEKDIQPLAHEVENAVVEAAATTTGSSKRNKKKKGKKGGGTVFS